jgi:NAD(P)-dependent dehydrogenase (short-subunit alcohol dehydrogenase family)
MSEADARAVVELNLFGAMNCSRAALPDMIAAQHGKIINIVSEAGRQGEPRRAAYSGAKAGMMGFAKALAREYGRDCINVNIVALGAVSHEGILDGATAPSSTPENNERLKKMLNAYPLGRGLNRLAIPDDVAGIVCLLASDRAAFITGQSIGVNGGFVML